MAYYFNTTSFIYYFDATRKKAAHVENNLPATHPSTEFINGKINDVLMKALHTGQVKSPAAREIKGHKLSMKSKQSMDC